MGSCLDDHILEQILEIADVMLMPDLVDEIQEYEKLKDCPSYAESVDVCKVLNIILKYANGYSDSYRWTPKKLLEEYAVRNDKQNLITEGGFLKRKFMKSARCGADSPKM